MTPNDDDSYTGARVQRLALHVAAWSVLWLVILKTVPPGKSDRNHIVSLNAAHGLLCTLAAAATVSLNLDSTMSVAVSLSYFLVDLVAMVHADGLQRLTTLHRSRQMDYVHHVLGLVWGFVFFVQEAHTCDASTGNPYVWIQTNEVSTPFYNWFRLTNSKLAGALFALSFFASRIVFNTFVLLPKFVRHCDVRYLLATAPFFLMQYVWFAMIMNKMHRTLTGASKSKSSSKAPQPAISTQNELEPLAVAAMMADAAVETKKEL